MRLLLAEDEPDMASLVAKGLREQSYAVDLAMDGGQALYCAEVNSYDFAILDVRLPVKDGFSVCRELRQRGFTGPILLLTAMDDPEDVMCGLNCGADDYLAKPFDFAILLARMRALLRRSAQTRQKTIQIADLTLNTLDHSALRGGRSFQLTATEYALLELLMTHAGEVLTRETIAQNVWKGPFDPLSNVIDVYINRLRKKVDQGTATPLLHTHRNEGYTLGLLTDKGTKL